MSIIDPKYRTKYRGNADWLSSFIDEQVKQAVTREKTVTAEDGTKTTEVVKTAKTRIDMPSLFGLAEANHLDVAKYKADAEKPNAPGRLRMTIGNMLRAVARKRHGLYDIEGVWHDAPADFIGDAEKVQNPDGSKIAKATEDKEQGQVASEAA